MSFWTVTAEAQALLRDLSKDSFEVVVDGLVKLGVTEDEDICMMFFSNSLFVLRVRPCEIDLLFNVVRFLFRHGGRIDIQTICGRAIRETAQRTKIQKSYCGDLGVSILLRMVSKFVKTLTELEFEDWEIFKIACGLPNAKWAELMWFLQFGNCNPFVTALRQDNTEKLRDLTNVHNFDFNSVIDDVMLECWGLKSETMVNVGAFFGAGECVKHLVLNGSVIDKASFACFAIQGGNTEIVRLAEQWDCEFQHGLEFAAKLWQLQLFQWLLDGKDQVVTEKSLCGAASTNNLSVISAFASSVTPTIAVAAVEGGACDVVKYLLSEADVQWCDSMSVALVNQRITMAKLLLESGKVDVNFRGVSSCFTG